MTLHTIPFGNNKPFNKVQAHVAFCRWLVDFLILANRCLAPFNEIIKEFRNVQLHFNLKWRHTACSATPKPKHTHGGYFQQYHTQAEKRRCCMKWSNNWRRRTQPWGKILRIAAAISQRLIANRASIVRNKEVKVWTSVIKKELSQVKHLTDVHCHCEIYSKKSSIIPTVWSFFGGGATLYIESQAMQYPLKSLAFGGTHLFIYLPWITGNKNKSMTGRRLVTAHLAAHTMSQPLHVGLEVEGATTPTTKMLSWPAPRMVHLF